MDQAATQMLPRWKSEQRFIETVARICHEANRLYCLGLGDTSQPHWDEAPEWQRDSAIAGVRFHMEHPGAPASLSHDEWMKHKLADGWKYGPEKDPEKKEHPCMVPFEELPPEQQFKDHLFSGIVNAAFAAQ